MPRHPSNLHGPHMLTEPGELVDVRVDFRDPAVSDIFQRAGGAPGIRLVIVDRDGKASLTHITIRQTGEVEVEAHRDVRKPDVYRVPIQYVRKQYRTRVYSDHVLNVSTVDEFQKVKS